MKWCKHNYFFFDIFYLILIKLLKNIVMSLNSVFYALFRTTTYNITIQQVPLYTINKEMALNTLLKKQ